MGKVGLMMEKDKIYHYLKGLRPEIAEQLHYQFDGYNSSLSDYMKKAFSIEDAKLEFRGKFSKPPKPSLAPTRSIRGKRR